MVTKFSLVSVWIMSGNVDFRICNLVQLQITESFQDCKHYFISHTQPQTLLPFLHTLIIYQSHLNPLNTHQTAPQKNLANPRPSILRRRCDSTLSSHAIPRGRPPAIPIDHNATQ